MNSSKSEDSILPSHPSVNTVLDNRENALTKRTTLTYESIFFSGPAVDQLNGLLPDFNNRLSPERNLGLSSIGQPRLSPETHPRLVSSSFVGLSSLQSPEILPQKLESPVGKGFEIKPDLAGRTLLGENARSIGFGTYLPIAPLGSRLVTLRHVGLEERKKE